MVLQCFNIQQWSEYQEESYLDVHSDHNNNNNELATHSFGETDGTKLCGGVWVYDTEGDRNPEQPSEK